MGAEHQVAARVYALIKLPQYPRLQIGIEIGEGEVAAKDYVERSVGHGCAKILADKSHTLPIAVSQPIDFVFMFKCGRPPLIGQGFDAAKGIAGCLGALE